MHQEFNDSRIFKVRYSFTKHVTKNQAALSYFFLLREAIHSTAPRKLSNSLQNV